MSFSTKECQDSHGDMQHCVGMMCWSDAVQVLLLAMDVARRALQTLQHTSAVLEVQEHRIKGLVRSKSTVEPVPPETPQLLPTIHALWSPLVNSLKVPLAPHKLNVIPCRREHLHPHFLISCLAVQL